MLFLAIFAISSLLGTRSFALPSPLNDGEPLKARTVCSSSITADVRPNTFSHSVNLKLIFDSKFNDLVPLIELPTLPDLPGLPIPDIVPFPPRTVATGNLDIVPSPYRKLGWNNGFRFIKGPNGGNVALFNDITELLALPRISIIGNVNSFTLKSIFLLCSLQSQGAVTLNVPCTFTAVGTKTNGDQVTKDFEYTPSGLKQFVLPNYFTGLKDVLFKLSGNPVLDAVRTTLVDNVVYNIKTC